MLLPQLVKETKKSLWVRIKTAFVYALLGDVPSCHGKYDEWNGDYDCDYEFAGEIGCEDCICNYENTGGRIDPRTGKKSRRHFT